MIYKTQGIVFRFTKFRETSIIVTIFTELFGLRSYIVNGVRSSKTSGNKIALYQPLTLLDLVVYNREHANINRIKEAKCLYPYHSLSTDVKKATLAMFINEVINKTIKEESHTGDLFEFLSESLIELDRQVSRYENFHLIFLVKLSRYLGFGVHEAKAVTGRAMMDERDEQALSALLEAGYTDPFALSNAQRRVLLDCLLKFYGEHLETFGEVKSVQVLRELFL